jgi:membrane-bound lytic murein transglycosylase B
MQPICKRQAAGAPSPPPASFSFSAFSCFPLCHPKMSRRRRFAIRICLGIALLSAFGAHPADAGTAPASLPRAFETGDPLAAWIAEAAHRFDIPASWIRDVMRIESGGDARAVSPKGAIGLMQLMPETWADLRLRYGLGSDPFDPRDNILAGAAYLRELHDRFGDPGFLAAYNAGPARYEAFLATGRPLPDETRAYIGALSPLTAGGGAEAHLALASQVPSSAEAPLFLLIPAHSSAARGLSFAVQHERSSAIARVADLTGFVPQSTGLFISVSRQNSTP